MTNDLPGEVVEEIGLLFVRHIVKIDQASNNVVLEPALLDAAFSQREDLRGSRPELLDPQLLGNRRVVNCREVQRERAEPGLHVPDGHDEDPRNVDGAIRHGTAERSHDLRRRRPPSEAPPMATVPSTLSRISRTTAACTSALRRNEAPGMSLGCAERDSIACIATCATRCSSGAAKSGGSAAGAPATGASVCRGPESIG